MSFKAKSWPSIVSCACLLFAGPTGTANATLTAYDDFNYFNVGGDLNGNGSGGSLGFNGPWTGQTSYNIAGGSLVSPVNPLPLVGNSVTAVAFGQNRDIDRDLATPLGAEGTSIYVSALIQPQGILHQGSDGGWFGLVLRGSTFISIGMNSSSSNYGMSFASVESNSSVGAMVGKTAFLVLRIDFTEGLDPAYLYVNPQPGAPEPVTPSVSQINLGIENITRISLSGPGAAGFDALRIGTSYGDVAPATADFNDSGAVNASDFNAWKIGYGSTNAPPSFGDANYDLDVDGDDFLIWQRQRGWDKATAASPMPEPAAPILILAGLLASQLCRRSIAMHHH